MDRSDVITLVKVTYTTDSIGQQKSQETLRPVYCKIRSVSQKEWFAGAQNNMRPELEVSMFRFDYEGEKTAEHNGKRYGVYRTYLGTGDSISLYLEDKAGL